LFFDNYLLHSNGNCSADVDAILVGYKTTGKNVPDDIEEEHEVSQPFQVNESDYQLPAAKQNLFMENAITYVTGYLLKKSLQQHQCQICSKELVNNDQLDSSSIWSIYYLDSLLPAVTNFPANTSLDCSSECGYTTQSNLVTET
jgi:hypothetical protein